MKPMDIRSNEPRNSQTDTLWMVKMQPSERKTVTA
jgi:hypothetical protein